MTSISYINYNKTYFKLLHDLLVVLGKTVPLQPCYIPYFSLFSYTKTTGSVYRMLLCLKYLRLIYYNQTAA